MAFSEANEIILAFFFGRRDKDQKDRESNIGGRKTIIYLTDSNTRTHPVLGWHSAHLGRVHDGIGRIL